MKIEDTYYWRSKKLYVARMRFANDIEKLIKPLFIPILN